MANARNHSRNGYGVEATYNLGIIALRGVTLSVQAGESSLLCLLNGAGKSTTLKAASNLLGAERGQVVRGEIRYDGNPTKHCSAATLPWSSAAWCRYLKARHCFRGLTVEENLMTGALSRRSSRRDIKDSLEYASMIVFQN